MEEGDVSSTVEEPQKYDLWRSHRRSDTAVFAFLLREGQILLLSKVITPSLKREGEGLYRVTALWTMNEWHQGTYIWNSLLCDLLSLRSTFCLPFIHLLT